MALNEKLLKTAYNTFTEYLSNNIPERVTNVFWQLFNGVRATLTHIDYKVDITRRENNILTASQHASLRSLAAKNGYEPSLLIPSSGIIQINLSPQIFNTFGYPLYIPAYAEFTCEQNGLTYYYDSDRPLKLTNISHQFRVVEGSINTEVFAGNSDYIQRIYLKNKNIAQDSIIVLSETDEFREVSSFYDNEGLYNDKQFIVKFSSDAQFPIVLYIKGSKQEDVLSVTYRVTGGEAGNMNPKGVKFSTDDIIDGMGNPITYSNEECEIVGVMGFKYGSNGDDENSMRAAIGYNHGNNLLFDSNSYSRFINKYSTLLLQSVITDKERKTINNIRVCKKQSINNNGDDIINEYKAVIKNNKYILTIEDKKQLAEVIREYEYALTSSNILDPEVRKYAFQIKYSDIMNKKAHESKLNKLIYGCFARMLFDRAYKFNIDMLITDYCKENNITVSWTMFTDDESSVNIISHDDKLPILCGDFPIKDSDGNKFNLFADINSVI